MSTRRSTVTPDRAALRPKVWRELGIGLGLFGLYLVVDLLGGAGRRAAADRHAWGVVHLERWLHIEVEPSVNHWLAGHHTLTVLADYEYAFTYVVSALILIVWVYLRRPEAYPFVRNSFLVLNVLGIGCFLLWPLTPPRMLPGFDVVDTVRAGHTVGSWGSPMVAHANNLAAMPSLHVAWALWVSVILARLMGGRKVQAVSAVHVAVTFLVIVSTANHYILDAAGGAIAVYAGVGAAELWCRRPRPEGAVVPSADAFFWYVDSPTTPQQVGGMVVFEPATDESTGPGGPHLDAVRQRLEQALPHIPAFRRRMVAGSRWRRPRWVEADEVDLTWHVTEHDLAAGGQPVGLAGLHDYVAEQTCVPMPLDRPLWRMMLLRGVAEDRAALVFLVHHTVADGLGVVATALRFLDPDVTGDRVGDVAVPGRLARAAGTALGLAQLATDGSPTAALSARSSADRQFGVVDLDLDLVRRTARAHGCRVTDVLLTAVAGGFLRLRPDLADQVRSTLRAAVPLLVADPRTTTGNVTAAVMVDLPLEPMPERERLAAVAARTGRLHTPSRALASRMVMARGLALAPAPVARWFARTVYGRRFFHGIVSNMTGPTEQLHLAGAALDQVVPILPLAPGAPFALGALSWNGVLGIGLATDPTVVSADQLCARLADVVAELATGGPAVATPEVGEALAQPAPGGPQLSARKSRAF